MKQFFTIFACALLLATPIAVGATSIATTSEETANTFTEAVYDGIEVDEVTTAPTDWRLFWRGVGERIRLATTFDTVEKAELRLKYAEERQAIAERIIADSDDEDAVERAERVLARSSELIDRVSERMDEIVARADDRAERLLENITTFEARRTERIADMEARILERVADSERAERLLNRLDAEREKVANRTERLTTIITNREFSEDARERLQRAAQRVHTAVSSTADVRVERQVLLEAVRNGEDGSRDALRELNQERREHIRNIATTTRRAIDRVEDTIDRREQQRDAMRGQDYNAARSNKPSAEKHPDDSNRARVMPAQSHNSSRSNRTEGIASPDALDPDDDGDVVITDEEASATNVCDGVTCADGSCAATADECLAVDTSVQTRRDRNPLYQSDTRTGSSAIYEGE